MPDPHGTTRCDSWKEIACYLRRTVRTVQRWEREGLPVYRQLHSRGGSVYAYPGELDAWLEQRATLDEDGIVESGDRNAINRQVAPALGTETVEDRTTPALPTGSRSAEAYSFYLLSRFHADKRTLDGLQKAIHCARLAIDRDPEYAAAHAALGQTLAVLATYTPFPPVTLAEQASAAAERSVELDCDFADAHMALGIVRLSLNQDLHGAGESLMRAIALRPSNANGHHWLAFQRLAIGDDAAAEEEIVEAKTLDPISPLFASQHGWILLLLRRYADALVVLRAALQLDPLYFRTHLNLGWLYLELRNATGAVEELRRAYTLSHYSVALAALAEGHARAGNRTEAMRLLTDLEAGPGYASRYFLARAHAWLDGDERCLAILTEAIDAREWFVILMGHDPSLDPVRGDPRFVQLMQRVGLPTRSQ